MHLIKKMLAQIEASPTLSNFKPNIIDAIRMISAALEEVKPETIKNCFQKAGWKKADNAIMQNKDENNMNTIPLSVLREQIHLPETMTFEDYVYVDNELHAHEELTEEDILASLQVCKSAVFLNMSTITRHLFVTFSSDCLYFIAIYHCPHYDF